MLRLLCRRQSAYIVDILALFGESHLILGHHITLRVRTCVQVARLLEHRPARLRKLFKRKIKQPVVIGLYRKIAPVAQYTRIPCEKAAIGQAALCMTRLRPRVAEIQIYPIYRVRREQLVDAVGISRIKAQIIRQPPSSAIAFSIASMITSVTSSTAIKLYPGFPTAVSVIKRPLPQPISTRSGLSVSPNTCAGSAVSRCAHARDGARRYVFFVLSYCNLLRYMIY